MNYKLGMKRNLNLPDMSTEEKDDGECVTDDAEAADDQLNTTLHQKTEQVQQEELVLCSLQNKIIF